MSEHPLPAAADEIATWYERRLRPKLARAAREQTISQAAAVELERQMALILRRRPPRERSRGGTLHAADELHRHARP